MRHKEQTEKGSMPQGEWEDYSKAEAVVFLFCSLSSVGEKYGSLSSAGVKYF